MKRMLVTGARGMLGRDFHETLQARGIDTVGVGREELDVTREPDVDYLLSHVRPDVVVNCAAYTAVDDCEANREMAHLVNADAVRYLADHCNRWGSMLVHFSTDFVFDGTRRQPYEVDDEVGPLSVYGESKLAGERSAATAWKHLIIRTSWVFGPYGKNFVEAIAGQIEKGRDHLRVVDDQRGRPTYVPHLVDAALRLIDVAGAKDEARGTYHYADQPFCTWFEFAREIAGEMQRRGDAPSEVEIEPITTEEMPRPARRPAWSVLSTSRYEMVTGTAPELWQMGLVSYFDRRTTTHDKLSS